MRKRGMTLIELMVAITLGVILLLVMTIQFAANLNFQTAINNQIMATQEAEIAMYNMTQILRFACSSPTAPSNTDKSGNGYSSPITATIQTTTIVNGKFSNSTTSVEYGLKNGNLYYIPNTASPSTYVIIARNIITFTTTWNSANNSFSIQLLAQEGNQSVTLNTTIYALPN